MPEGAVQTNPTLSLLAFKSHWSSRSGPGLLGSVKCKCYHFTFNTHFLTLYLLGNLKKKKKKKKKKKN